jgi:ribonuclease J
VIDLIRDLATTVRGMLRNAVAIISEPEPELEESTEYQVIANWFIKLGIQHYRIRVSGHYYPYELRDILSKIKPKKVLPIHTQNSKILSRLITQIYEAP